MYMYMHTAELSPWMFLDGSTSVEKWSEAGKAP